MSPASPGNGSPAPASDADDGSDVKVASRRESPSPLVAFQDQVNRLFDEFWRDSEGVGSSLLSSSFGYPRVEMSESARELKVQAELPGLDETDVEVLLRDGDLIVRGERRSETEDSQRDWQPRSLRM